MQSFQAHTGQPEPGAHIPLPGLSLPVLEGSSPEESRGLK